METPVWIPLISGLVGAIVGGVATFSATWLALRHERRIDERRWEREQQRHRGEVYAHFLAATREYVSGRTVSIDLLPALYHAQLLSGREVKVAVNRLYRVALYLVNADDGHQKEELRAKFDDELTDFINSARSEIGSPPLREQPSEAPQQWSSVTCGRTVRRREMSGHPSEQSVDRASHGSSQ